MTARWRWWATITAALTLVACVAAGAAIAGTAQKSGPTAKSTIKVGIIYSRTGALSGFGAEYIQGLKLGLQYVTKGTNQIDGHPIQLTIVDDAGDPAKAVTAAKDLIGQGYKILGGSVSSGVALQLAPLAAQNNILYISGPAASDAITGLNRNTFRSGRQSYQDVANAAGIFPPKTIGKKIVVFVEDTAFGNGTVSAVQQVFGGKGHTVSKIAVPFQSNDITPFALQLKNAKPDAVYIAWAGSNALQMLQTLQQQGVPQSTEVITSLAQRSTYAPAGPMVQGLKLVSHYVYQAPKNPVNDWLIKTMRRKGQVPDIFTPDGFVAAQMIARAITKAGGDDVGRMIAALEGYQFLGPKGIQRIRPEDHAMQQPMFQVQLVKQANGRYEPKVLKTVGPGNVQPPLKRFP